MYFSYRVDRGRKTRRRDKLLAFKDTAWRGIFWVSLPPGILFVIGSFMVAESPRWLLAPRQKKDAAYAALLRSRSTAQADLELKEMQESSPPKRKASGGTRAKESLLRRKYVIPFVLACIILACNQATGINSIIAYNTNILLQSGLSDIAAHWGYVLFTLVNFPMTFGGVMLVDRKGRKFLLSLGTAGIIVSLICTGVLFLSTEKLRVDARSAVQSMVSPDQKVDLLFNQEFAGRLLTANGNAHSSPERSDIAGRHLFLRRFSRGESRPCAPTILQRSRSRSPAKAAFLTTRWSHFSRIPSAISMPHDRLR